MKYLKQTWIRVLLSLLAGGLVMEFIAIGSADPNYKHTPRPGAIPMLVIAVIVYLLLTAYVKRKTRLY